MSVLLSLNLSSVLPHVHPPETGLNVSEAGSGFSETSSGSGVSEAGSGLPEASSGLEDASHGMVAGEMDGQTDSPCILQDFVPSGSLQGCCPAYLTATIMKY